MMQYLKGSDTLREMYPKVNENFENIDDQLKTHEQNFEDIDDRLNAHEQNFGNIEENIQQIETNLQDISDSFNAHKDEYAAYKNSNNLEIAKIKKEIADYKAAMALLNPNHEAKQAVEGYGIVNLPPNCANGQVSVTLFGNTEVDEEGNTKSTLSGRVKSVGKNLFEPTLNGWIKDAGGALTLNDSVFTYKRTSGGNFDEIYKFFKVIPNQPYTLQLNVLSIANAVRVRAYDKTIDGTLLESKLFGNIGLQTITFTPQTEDVVIAFGGSYANSECSFNFVQLEKGDQATDYEPYKESNAYIIAKDPEAGEILELRSLPNGTKDEIRASERKVIIRTNKVVIDGTEAGWVYGGMFEGMLYFYIANWGQDNNCVLGQDNWGVARNDIHTFETTSDLASGTTNFKMLVLSTGMAVAIDREYFEANYPSTLDGFKQYLGEHPIQLIYQLAQEQVIPVQVSGTLVGFPSGTVYWEQIVPDAGVYTDKMEVMHKDLPIKSIEKLSKVDFTTGVEYELDPSQAVVSANRLSFTHPELQEGDITFFIYAYEKESTTPEMTIQYYDSRYVVKDAVTGKFYKWELVVANGQWDIALEEV